jgi:hypothetical protein
MPEAWELPSMTVGRLLWGGGRGGRFALTSRSFMQVPGPGGTGPPASVMLGRMEKCQRGVIHLNRGFASRAQARGASPIALTDVSRCFPNRRDDGPWLVRDHGVIMAFTLSAAGEARPLVGVWRKKAFGSKGRPRSHISQRVSRILRWVLSRAWRMLPVRSRLAR